MPNVQECHPLTDPAGGDGGEHPQQTLSYPGQESDMAEQPRDEMQDYVGRSLLAGQVALVTGGDSGIGRAVAVAFAKEGADVAISYLSEHHDAKRTGELVEAAGRRFLALPGDLADHEHRGGLVEKVVKELGRLDVLVNNAAFQQPVDDVSELDLDQWRHTFAVNVEAMFFLTQAAVPHMTPGSTIVNTTSVTGLTGNKALIDYAATKGAIIALTQSLAQILLERGIRVNAVAPGPVWTPLIPATMDAEKVQSFGGNVPYGRAAQPDEIAPSYVFFASNQLSNYITGEVLAALGGQTLPG